MSCELKYGENETIWIDVPRDAILADCTRPRGTPLDDPAAAVAAALAAPLDFPPVAQATIPGDRVVFALEGGVPQSPAVVAGAVHALLGSGTRAEQIGIVLASGCHEEADATRSLLPEPVPDCVEVSVHDPTDPASLCYLAASREGKPIYFNRRICEADVVLPISTLRLEESLGYAGVHAGLFPTFSDEATQQRFRAPSSTDWSVHQRRRREEADEAAWLLGVQFTLQVMPGPGNSVLHVLAGDANAVARRGKELCEAAWLHRSPRRASLVVATIEGGPQQQTWENFARALFTAMRAVDEGGAILLCTSLRCPPGPALQRLATALDGDDEVVRQLRRGRSADAVSASLLAEARRRAQVYLISGLDGDVVEDLGLGHVSKADEVQRLSRQHGSCILLGNAHHAVLATSQG